MTSTSGSANCASGRPSEAGAGVLATFTGASIFLVLLLFAVQVVLGLYATSVVSASAYDAAKAVAGADAGGRVEAQQRATASLRSSLGRMGPRAEVRWSRDGDDVVLYVRVPRPTVLSGTLLPGPGDVERTVRLRLEAVR